MTSFDVQSVGIDAQPKRVFDFMSRPANLPCWTNAFERADEQSAELATPRGSVRIELATITHEEAGTVDWRMAFPDGSVGNAYARVTPNGSCASVVSFVLMAPPSALEGVEGALDAQREILREELAQLKRLLEGRDRA